MTLFSQPPRNRPSLGRWLWSFLGALVAIALAIALVFALICGDETAWGLCGAAVLVALVVVASRRSVLDN